MIDGKDPPSKDKAKPLVEASWEDLEFDTAKHPFEGDGDETERATAMPPTDYEAMAKSLMGGVMSEEEEKRALTAPGIPVVEPTRAAFPTLLDPDAGSYDHDELEASIPLLGFGETRIDDRHAIPLEDFDFPDSKRPALTSPSDASDLFREEQRTTTKTDMTQELAKLCVESQPAPSFKRESLLDLPVGDEVGGALDLIRGRTTPPPVRPDDPLVDMRDRYAVGDFSGALAKAESILAVQPNNAEATRYADACKDVLTQMYTARIGSLLLVPKIIVPQERIKWLTLDHRTGFLLSCIDGRSSVEEILDVSGMPALDSLKILCDLIQQQVIGMRER